MAFSFHREMFHYTSREGYRAIMREPDRWIDQLVHWAIGKPEPLPLHPTLGEGGMDAHYGPGWYLTDIQPGSRSRQSIACSLWDSGGFQLVHKTEYWLKYRIHVRAVKRCRAHVFLVSSRSSAKFRFISSGKTPDEPVLSEQQSPWVRLLRIGDAAPK